MSKLICSVALCILFSGEASAGWFDKTLDGLSDMARKTQRQIEEQAQKYKPPVRHDPLAGREFTETDVQEIVKDPEIKDSVTIEDNTYLTVEQLHEMWEENMRGFTPDDVSTFVVKGSHAATVFEDIGHTKPTEIRGAYYTHNEGKTINVFVIDPQNRVIFKRSAEVQGIVQFETTEPGKYTFIFSNLDDWQDRTVTFALHTFEEKEELIQYTINEQGEVVVQSNDAVENQQQEDLDLAGDEDVKVVRNQLKKVLKIS